jgi:hypothetical protein
MRTPPCGRLTASTAALLAALASMSAVLVTPAAAAPGDEGSNPTLRETLEAASKGYVEAQAALDASRRRQAELTQQAAHVEAQLAARSSEAASIAVTAYRTGGLRTASAILSSASPDSFVDRATAIKVIASRNDHQLRQLSRLRKELAAARAAIDAEIARQQQQAAEMAKRKQDTERALASVGGRATGGYVNASSPLAKPAPRRPDGSWPPESCSVNDPTTSGCLTPRTLHALQQAQAAGFTRYVACYRPSGPYEHPKGRACDFAAQATGFGGVATGGDRLYGNNLAAFFVRNADRLGVLYVIWYKQIWVPATGWRAYSGGGGDPSSDHTNHVHLSII